VCHNFLEKVLLRDSQLYPWLMRLDRDLAQEAKDGGCIWCGGRLDCANYPRKPRGGPPDLGEDYDRRLSFCCAEEDCRRRVTPVSVRFLGRRVYLSAVVVLVSAMLHGATPPRAARLRELFGVSARTLGRWRDWWQAAFAQSAFWKAARGLLRSAADTATLPLSLLRCFGEPGEREPMVAALKFLSPITTASAKGSRALRLGSGQAL
jgi:hypothetical protein